MKHTKLKDIGVKSSEVTYESLQAIATSIAHETSRRILGLHYQGEAHQDVGREGATGHELIKVDLIADQVIHEIAPDLLLQGVGRVSVYTEEGGVYHFGDKSNGIFLVVDPLDGSKLIRRGAHAPHTAVSVATGLLSDIGDSTNYGLVAITASCVQDIWNCQRYCSTKGDLGSRAYNLAADQKSLLITDHMNRDQITIDSKCTLAEAILSIDLDNSDSVLGITERMRELAGVVQATMRQRRLGSSVLDYVGVCNGFSDGFISYGGRVKLHDIAAAQHLVAMAGGINKLTPLGEGAEKMNILQYIFCDANPDEATRIMKKTKWKVIAAANPSIMEDIEKHLSNKED